MDEEALDSSDAEEDEGMGGDESDQAEQSHDETEQAEQSPENNVNETHDGVAEEEAPEELKAKRVPNAADPTRAEREGHFAIHLPYRPWCKVCVAAKAREDPHYRRMDQELQEGILEVAMDYASIAERRDKALKMMLSICKDTSTKSFCCFTVKC